MESSPAQTSKVLGSTAHALVCGLQNSSSSLPSGNFSVLVSPGLRAHALEALELADGARCRSPALVDVDLRDGIARDEPVLVTSTETSVASPALMLALLSRRLSNLKVV